MALVNLLDIDLRGEIGFFGTPLSTNNFTVIAPFTTVGGTVISTNPNNYGSTFTSWNNNTGAWVNWNPSSSIIYPGSKVEYAFMVWSTAYYPPQMPAFEIAANTRPIVLQKPDLTTVPVYPNASYNLNFNAGWWQFTHGADITSIMQDNQYGDYKATAIGTGSTGGSYGLGTWGIYILYSNPAYPYRNANLNVGATGFNTTVTVSNLVLPVTGPVMAKIYLESVQGDRGYPDSLLLNGVKLSGPFNPQDDFMNDRFVDYTGASLQTVGSLLPEIGGTYGYFADQTVIINNTILTNTDTNAVLTQQNSGDWAGVSFLGFLIDLNSATLDPLTKSVNKNYALPGDILNYQIVFKNIGTVSAMSILLLDTLPTGLSFISSSLKVNSTPYSGDITTGLTLPDLGVNGVYTVDFSVQVTPSANIDDYYLNSASVDYYFIPTPGTLINSTVNTNYVLTTVANSTLSAVKSVDTNVAKIGDILTYTIVLSNIGNRTDYNISFLDTLPINTTLVPNSLKQDNVQFSYNSNGMTLPNSILANGTSTIIYKLQVNGNPIPNPILNSGNFNYSFILDPTTTTNTTITKSTNSNIVPTAISFVDFSSITKYVDKAFASSNQTLTYTIVIPNNGNIQANNLIFVDTMPNGTTFINNSFTLNGNIIFGANPSIGINIGSINPNEFITITFSVTVN